jgi:DNA replication protein DnaC
MSDAVRELPPLPSGIRTLTDAEADRLRATIPAAELPVDPQHCITCEGTGTFQWHAGGRICEWKCNCIDQWIMHRYFLHSGIGLSYQRLAWTDVRPDHPAIEVITDYEDNSDAFVRSGVGLVLHGPNGTGKTLFAALLLKSLLARGHDGYLTTFREMLDTFTRGFRDNVEQRWFHKRVKNAGVLVVDEVGKESGKDRDFPMETLEDLIRHRVAHARPTIITTNYGPDKVRSGYGSGLVSLLSERSIFYECRGEDFRPTSNTRVVDEARQNLTRPVTVG